MARLYADENFPRQTVIALRRLGHDVVTAFEAGRANKKIPDEKVLAETAREERIVITLNRREFIRLNKSQKHCGIIVCTADRNYEALAARIHDALSKIAEHSNTLIRVNLKNTT